jgi:hypothetical protein
VFGGGRPEGDSRRVRFSGITLGPD